MIKVFCDACEKRGYIDAAGNQHSGRIIQFDLCAACMNKAETAAYEAIGKPSLKETPY